jgi:hypothetical protein
MWDLVELFAAAEVPLREPDPDVAVIEAILLQYRDLTTR